MNHHSRTFKVDKLYHQFLKPKGISESMLVPLVGFLVEAEFISMSDVDRYIELHKLTSGEHKNELFKLIGSLNGLE
jgi:hypothetical protein